MEKNEIKEIFQEFINEKRMRLFLPATKEEIRLFEENKRVNLPCKYKEWLEYSDGGELFLPAGIQLYGVKHKPIIDLEDLDRPNDNYIVIGRLSSGDPILCEKANERISIYNLEAERIEEDESYCDFDAFLKQLTRILGEDNV